MLFVEGIEVPKSSFLCGPQHKYQVLDDEPLRQEGLKV